MTYPRILTTFCAEVSCAVSLREHCFAQSFFTIMHDISAHGSAILRGRFSALSVHKKGVLRSALFTAILDISTHGCAILRGLFSDMSSSHSIVVHGSHLFTLWLDYACNVGVSCHLFAWTFQYHIRLSLHCVARILFPTMLDMSAYQDTILHGLFCPLSLCHNILLCILSSFSLWLYNLCYG